MKVKKSIKFQLVWYICHVDIFAMKQEMNRCYYSRPLFEKSESIKENIKSKNIIFLRLAFFEIVKSVWN